MLGSGGQPSLGPVDNRLRVVVPSAGIVIPDDCLLCRVKVFYIPRRVGPGKARGWKKQSNES